MSEQYANDPGATLNGNITSSSSSFILSSATGYPGSGTFRVRIENEIIIVGSISGATCGTLTRGAEGTTAASHSSGAAVALVLSAGGLTGILQQQSSVLGVSFVDTAESTSNTSYTDLGTPDSVTFTLPQTTTVIVQYSCSVFTGSGLVAFNQANVDGTLTGLLDQAFTSSGGAIITMTYGYSVSLAAGTHTIKIQHKVSANSGQWQGRLLTVLGIP